MLTLAVAFLLSPKPTWTQKLPDGTPVTLVAVSDFYYRKSWSPDGTAQKTWTVPGLLKQLYESSSEHPAFLKRLTNLVVQLKPKDPNSQPSVAFKIGKQNLGYGYTLKDMQTKGLWWAGAASDNSKLPKAVDLTVGVGVGAWKHVSRHDLQTGMAKGPKFFGNIVRRPGTDADHPAIVIMEATVPEQYRGKDAILIKLYDIKGHALQPAGSGPIKPGQPSRYFFHDTGFRLVHADLLVQPYNWLTFKGVHTKPA